MFAGLLLASLSVAVAQTALFQRKARAGWLDELDDLRARSLDRPDGAIGEVVEGDDIWTDLREGGQYDDPHEISSLYADDDRKARPASRPAITTTDAAPPRSSAPPAAPSAELQVAPEVDADIWTHSDRAGDPVVAPGASYESDQLWAQPAPHPKRPSEMWHPAELDARAMDDEAWALGAELATQFVDGAPEAHAPEPSPATDPSPAPEAPAPAPSEVSSELESQLLAAADVAVLEPAAPASTPAIPSGSSLPPAASDSWTEPLATTPVGRRHRRDRPVLPVAAAAGDASETQPLPSRGERSPLPEAPLPPAAVPAAPAAAVEPAAPIAPVEPVAPAVVMAPATEAAAPPADPGEVSVRADGLLDVEGTIVRLGGARRAAAASDGERTTVALDEGWCWVAPGEGMAAAVVIDLSTVELIVEPGATALAVAEADGSCFIVLADGHGQLRRGAESGALGRGAIVMVDPAGWAQIDQATDEEIVADPIVAENLAADAEL